MRESLFRPTGKYEVTINYGAYEWQRPGQLRFPGNVKRRYTFDPLQRFTSIEGDDPGDVPKLSIAYGAYTLAGNVSSKAIDGLSLAYDYDYDELYRLTGVTSNVPTHDETFTYDPNGNRLTLNGGSTWAYDHDEAPDGIGNNELRGNEAFSYQHDANGNLVVKISQDGTTATRYVYNAEDRLIRVEDLDPLATDPLTDPAISVIATYGYDPFGRRLWKDVDCTRTYYAYADEGLVAELDAVGTLVKTYGWQPGGLWGTNPLFQKIGDSYYWYLNDHLGTPQKMVDESGAVVWEAQYGAFGKATIGTKVVVNNLRFPGQYWDGETGIHYNLQRYYASDSGMYLQIDRLRDALNWYSYAGGNTVALIDPFGLDRYSDSVTIATSVIDIGATMIRVPKNPTQAAAYAVSIVADKANIGTTVFKDSKGKSVAGAAISAAGTAAAVVGGSGISVFASGYGLGTAINNLPVYGSDQTVGEWWADAIWDFLNDGEENECK